MKSRTMAAALEEAYQNQKMVGKFPGCVLRVTSRLNAVDVNVHPAKTEVKFTSDKQLFDAVYYAVKGALEAETGHPQAELTAKKPAPRRDSVTPNQTFFRSMTAAEFQAAQKEPRREDKLPLRDRSRPAYQAENTPYAAAARRLRQEPIVPQRQDAPPKPAAERERFVEKPEENEENSPALPPVADSVPAEAPSA